MTGREMAGQQPKYCARDQNVRKGIAAQHRYHGRESEIKGQPFEIELGQKTSMPVFTVVPLGYRRRGRTHVLVSRFEGEIKRN